MLRRLLLLAVIAAVAIFGGRAALLIAASSTPDATSTAAVPPPPASSHRAAIVLGAGLNANGTPSAVLRDRIRAGVQLKQRGQVDLLLMTGDNSIPGYNEPSAMRRAAIAQGVPATRIAADYGGRRTWDSCWRARNVFGVRRAIVVTNDFHRARAVELCKAAGIAVDGAVGTRSTEYAGYGGWLARETLASWRGVIDAWIHHPKVAVRGKRIDPYDPCSLWRSLDRADRAVGPNTAAPRC